MHLSQLNPLSPSLQPSDLDQHENYNGSGDPDDHIENHKWIMDAHYLDEKYKCILLLATLSGPTQLWYKSLPTESMHDFN